MSILAWKWLIFSKQKLIIMKKGNGGGKGKNPELRGGKNSLPQKNGRVDVKEVVKQGGKEAEKKWVDKKVVKNRSKPQTPAQLVEKFKNEKPKSKGKTEPAKAVATKGVDKLKAKTTKSAPQKGATTKTVSTPKKTDVLKGVKKLQSKASRSVKPKASKGKTAPTKKGPSKGR